MLVCENFECFSIALDESTDTSDAPGAIIYGGKTICGTKTGVVHWKCVQRSGRHWCRETNHTAL